MEFDVVIVGGGAAGMYCACRILSKRDVKLAVIDSNSRPGRKLLMTGGGRCNITNDGIDVSKYHCDSPDRLKELLSRHTKDDHLTFLRNELGVVPANKSGLYYPSTYRSETMVNALYRYIIDHNAVYMGDTTVTSVVRDGDGFIINGSITSKTVVIAAGGASYPVTGSNGGFISLLAPYVQSNDMEAIFPALVPLKSSDSDIRRLSGCRIYCDLALYDGRDHSSILSSSDGELLFTDYGVSGICVLDISGDAVRAMASGRKPVLSVNLIKMGREEAVDLIRDLFSRFPSRQISAALMGVIREEITEIILGRLKISKATAASEADEKMITDIAHMLTSFEIHINGSLGFDNAQITSGGIKLSSLTEDLGINGVPGLYACGEMLDCNGICGGYNLQFAWSSASVAADGVLSCLN